MRHGRYLRLDNMTSCVEVLGRPSLTTAVNSPPLFDGVRTLVVAGLDTTLDVTGAGGRVTIRGQGINGDFQAARVNRDKSSFGVRLDRTSRDRGPGRNEAIWGQSVRPDLTAWLGRVVDVAVDRPLGSRHPRHPDLVYPVNYGAVPGTVGGDGQSIHAYVLGIDTPVTSARGPVVAVVLRADDAEDKLVIAVDGRPRTVAEVLGAIAFQERHFAHHIVMG